MANVVIAGAGKLVLDAVGKKAGEVASEELGNVVETMIKDVTGSVSSASNNVFGTAIDDETAEKLLPKLAGKITSLHRARLALAVKNNDERFKLASNQVKELKKQSGDGVATLCLIYNATGNTLKLITNKDWYGHIGRDPYPTHLANGQWGTFLHEKTAIVASGSNAAVVYRGMNPDGHENDIFLSWNNPWRKIDLDNTVLAEISEVGHYDNNSVWDSLYTKLADGRSTSSAHKKGCEVSVSIGNGTSPTFTAVVTIDGA